MSSEYNAELEECVAMVLAAGLPTGHAESFTSLVRELIAEALDYRAKLRKVIEECDDSPT